MAKVKLGQVKKLREKTGAGVMEVRRALLEAGGDERKAIKILKDKGFEKAAKKETRAVKAGIVASYIHHTLTSGATGVLQSETDFVARNPEFQQLAHYIAVQGTAMAPADIPELLAQPFIKGTGETIGDLVNSTVQKFGERTEIGRIIRFSIK